MTSLRTAHDTICAKKYLLTPIVMNICDDAKRAKKKKRDSLFFKMFSPLIYFEQEKTIEKVSKKLYTSKLNEKKKKAETKNWVWD